MSSTGYESTDLLALFNRYAGRFSSGDTISDTDKYDRLAKAQFRVLGMASAVAPQAFYPATLATLSTSDGGQTFTFGTDGQGYAIAPMGKAQIYDNLASVPNFPWVEGWQYLNEGTRIRIPYNGTYSGTLYWRGITAPSALNATNQPVFFPEGSRELIVIDAVRQFMKEPGGDVGVLNNMNEEWQRAWPLWCLVWKTQFRHGGALGTGFTGLQLGLAGQATL
jgi:hypothetical protein